MSPVTCIECPFWPSQARNFRDPNDPILEEFDPQLFSSFHVVPISHKKSLRPDIEFRMSFSVAEKGLAKRWTTKQMECFAVCKDIVKEYVCLGQTPLCSYHIKTLMFWMIELYQDQDFWDEHEMYGLVHNFINHILLYSIQCKALRNYFVPSNNMLDHFEDKDFALYNTAIYGNFKILPSTVEIEQKKKHSVQEKIEDIVNVRIIKFTFFKICLSQFQTVASFLYSEHDIITASKFETTLVSLMSENANSMIDDLINILRIRCQAIFRMHDALEENTAERAKLLLEAESEFFQSLAFPEGPISDFNLTGYTYLAWFYFFTDEKEKCVDFIFKGIEAFHRCKQNYRIMPNTFTIPAGKKEAYPHYLKNEVVRFLHFLCSRSEPVYLDPVVVLCFLYFRIFGTKDLLDDCKSQVEERAQLHSFALIDMTDSRYINIANKIGTDWDCDNEVAEKLKHAHSIYLAGCEIDREHSSKRTLFKEKMDLIWSDETTLEEKRDCLGTLFPNEDFLQFETPEDLYEILKKNDSDDDDSDDDDDDDVHKLIKLLLSFGNDDDDDDGGDGDNSAETDNDDDSRIRNVCCSNC